MDNTNIVVLPVEQLRELIETTVCGCIEKVIGAFQPKHDSDSVDIEGALEFLNSNGYRIAKGQMYKETYLTINSGTGCISKFRNSGTGQNCALSAAIRWVHILEPKGGNHKDNLFMVNG